MDCKSIRKATLVQIQPHIFVAIKRSQICPVCGKKYGVSDKAIVKWVKDYGIDPKTVRTRKDNGFKRPGGVIE